MKPFIVAKAADLAAPAVAAGVAGIGATVGTGGDSPLADTGLLAALVAVVYLLIRVVESLVGALVRKVGGKDKGTDPGSVLVEIRNLLQQDSARVKDVHQWLNTERSYSFAREVTTFHKQLAEAIDRMARLVEQNGDAIAELRLDVREVKRTQCPIRADERLRELLAGGERDKP